MAGSLNSGFFWSRWQGNIIGACATRYFAYLARGPCVNDTAGGHSITQPIQNIYLLITSAIYQQIAFRHNIYIKAASLLSNKIVNRGSFCFHENGMCWYNMDYPEAVKKYHIYSMHTPSGIYQLQSLWRPSWCLHLRTSYILLWWVFSHEYE